MNPLLIAGIIYGGLIAGIIIFVWGATRNDGGLSAC